MNTGGRAGLPTAGARVTYGLGSESRNLPGFVVLGNTQGIKGGPVNWSAGFLPTTYQGTLLRAQGSPVLDLRRQGPVGAAAGGARGALRAGLQRRGVGRPQRPGGQSRRPLRRDGRADPRAADRPEGAGALGLDAGDLGGEFARMPVSQGSNGR